MARKQENVEYTRFSPAQRFEHILVIVSFTCLALTGIPQKYATHDWAQAMIDFLGGIESVRIVHRVMATVLMAESIYHGGVLSYKVFVLGERLTMMPTLRDLKNVWDWVRFNLGRVKQHPRMPRFNFGEKAEYLAMVWGTLVMIITGFMLARAAHGAEAVLAVASIITWHVYNVHLKHFNKSMFTGKLSRHEMEEEHAEELEMIERGLIPVPPPQEVIASRQRIFWPYAVVVTIILVGGLIYFVSFEETAIRTVPRLSAAADTAVSVDPDIGDPELGAQLWVQAACDICHGVNGEGVEGKADSLAGTSLSFESFVISTRRGPADMPAYNAGQLSDEDLAHMWVWLIALE